jgi:hypothetical protein
MTPFDPIQELNKQLRAQPPLEPVSNTKGGVYSAVSDLAFYESLPRLVEFGMGVPLVSCPGHRGVYLLVRLVQYQTNLAFHVTTENPLAFLISLKARIVKARGIHDLRQDSH